MAVVMSMEWDGVTAEEYDAVRKLVNWEGDAPAGGVAHIAAVTEQGLRITDVWESAEAFQTFVADRLMPGVRQLGLQGEPKIDLQPLHALFIPGLVRR